MIVSFTSPARTLSWAVLNGGFCHAHHVINHHVNGNDALFCAQPSLWLERGCVTPETPGKNRRYGDCRGDEAPGPSFNGERKRPGHLLYYGGLRQRSFGGRRGVCGD